MKKERKTDWKKVGLLALLVVGGVAAVAFSAKAAPNEILITDHDTVYDYLLRNGRWYTKRKGAEEWIDMQSALSPENYQLAVSRLQNFLNQ